MSLPMKNTQPFAALGGAVEPNWTVPPIGWFGMTMSELAIRPVNGTGAVWTTSR